MSEPVRVEEKDARSMSKAKEGGFFAELIKVLVQALVIALIVRSVLFQPFNIPSGSMIPTLLVGDYLFVSKYSYGYSRYSLPLGLDLFPGRIFASPPKRGDVIVFKLPRDTSDDYIKRLIGLPGDKIQMKEGRLYINGELVPREPIASFRQSGREVPTYRETLPGGVTHTIIEVSADRGSYDTTDVYEVPPNNYFMMGDNRDDSSDSRVSPADGGVGYVPFENLVGRAEVIFFSINGAPAWTFWEWPWTVRWNRLFQLVK
jgi:signal peptidase I